MFYADLWRIELLHPLVVHFAVAFMLLGIGLWPFRWFQNRGSFRFLTPASRLVLGLGILAGWLAVWSGQEAYSEVARTLCVPNMADGHRFYGRTAVQIVSVGFSLDLLEWWKGWAASFRKLWVGLLLVVFLVGGSFLLLAGERGAHLVYEQGAAVNAPDAECSRFETFNG